MGKGSDSRVSYNISEQQWARKTGSNMDTLSFGLPLQFNSVEEEKVHANSQTYSAPLLSQEGITQSINQSEMHFDNVQFKEKIGIF